MPLSTSGGRNPAVFKLVLGNEICTVGFIGSLLLGCFDAGRPPSKDADLCEMQDHSFSFKTTACVYMFVECSKPSLGRLLSNKEQRVAQKKKRGAQSADAHGS